LGLQPFTERISATLACGSKILGGCFLGEFADWCQAQIDGARRQGGIEANHMLNPE
jgi:hypothetical protein